MTTAGWALVLKIICVYHIQSLFQPKIISKQKLRKEVNESFVSVVQTHTYLSDNYQIQSQQMGSPIFNGSSLFYYS
ncbi:hypothetical protein FGO68_gene6995 [Halteria grandinella]|uniref:Uncharacterized protein n=1 Tax=Halteria grandinella TaxID=5974 RepID=A0A8J8P004_HALGN|nr:hypothetical protein FGO68_gene6995 [Halteria grandinella]